MDDIRVSQALRAHVADRPPLGLTSTTVIAAGRRSRRLRTARAVAGSVAAAVAVLGVVWTFVPGPGGGVSDAAAPDAAACASLRASPPRVDVAAVEEAADRLTCYLLDAVPSALPADTKLGDNVARPGTAGLVAVPGDVSDGDQVVSASATIMDAAGTGLLTFSVMRDKTFTPGDAASRCSSPLAKARCQTGPGGEHIEIYDFGKDAYGVRVLTIDVYTGHTLVRVGTSNAPESRSNDQVATRAEPLFTLDQLIALATAPELRFYP